MGYFSLGTFLTYVVLVALVYIFQNQIILLLNGEGEYLFKPFVIPWNLVLTSALYAALFIFGIRMINHEHAIGKTSTITEWILMAVLFLLFPFLEMIATWGYLQMLVQQQDIVLLSRHNMINTITSFLSYIQGASTGLFALFCGFSIAQKKQRLDAKL